MNPICKGIDVSKHQASIDWQKVKNAGYKFAMIRVGFRGYSNGVLKEDEYFRSNLHAASKLGFKIGLYFFSTAINEKEAVDEAHFVLNRIGEYKIEMPIVYDLEGFEQTKYRTYGITKAQRTKNCKAFNDVIKAAGYTVMLYGSQGNIRTTYDLDTLVDAIWCAKYAGGYKKVLDNEKYHPSLGQYSDRIIMWQYTSIGSVDGIKGNVDLNNLYAPIEQADAPANPYKEPAGTIKRNPLTNHIALESVKWMQWELVHAGFDIEIDGKFGKHTLGALEDFQRTHKDHDGVLLSVDGKCGAKTKLALKSLH